MVMNKFICDAMHHRKLSGETPFCHLLLHVPDPFTNSWAAIKRETMRRVGTQCDSRLPLLIAP